MRIIMITARKGGVTKTTLTVNSAYELSQKGFKVLIIDLDQQADTSKYYRWDNTEYYIGDVLLDKKFDINKAIYPAKVKGEEQENLHIITGRPNDEMVSLDNKLFTMHSREMRLSNQLKKIADQYDFVLIDTSPAANTLSMNAVIASDEYLFPADLTEHSLDGIDSILEHIEDLKDIEREEVNFLIVPSNVDKRTTKTLAYGEDYINEQYSGYRTETTIWKKSSIFNESERRHLPISVISKSDISAHHYRQLAQEIIDNAI